MAVNGVVAFAQQDSCIDRCGIVAFDSVKQSVTEGLKERSTIGLVGAEMASQPGIAALCEFIGQAGGRASPSSLKADVITRDLADALGAQKNRSVTVAPEAGSDRMRRLINKNLTEPEILRAAEWLVGGGVQSLKMYFMLGLPTEKTEDVEAIAELTDKIHERYCSKGAKVGGLTLSVNSFSPKPWTPLQWEPMEEMAILRDKFALLKKRLARLPRITVDTESPREAYYQTLLSRGDRRTGQILLEAHQNGGDWWSVVQRLRRATKSAKSPNTQYVNTQGYPCHPEARFLRPPPLRFQRNPAVGFYRSFSE